MGNKDQNNMQEHQTEDELQQQNKDYQQQSQFTIKEAEFKLENQKGQRTVVKLMMKTDFILIQTSCCNCFWKIELRLDQAAKIHILLLINESIEQLFSHIMDCFTDKQVSFETLEDLMHLHFKQTLGSRLLEFTITLKQGEVNMNQIIQDLSAKVISLEQKNDKQQKKIALLEENTHAQKVEINTLKEQLQKFRILNISKILKDNERDLVYSWVSGGKVVSHLDLLYRASEHGFQGQVFSKECDGKGPLICFVQSQSERRFGGFIDSKYKANLNEFIASNPSKSFIFSLDDQRQYLSNKVNLDQAYFSSKSFGFAMGGGHDLHLSDNCNINMGSHSFLSHSYGLNQGGNQTSLAGSLNFKVKEIEVFQVFYNK